MVKSVLPLKCVLFESEPEITLDARFERKGWVLGKGGARNSSEGRQGRLAVECQWFQLFIE